MSRYLAKVFVTLKPAVNDPQGVTIQGGLHTMGYTTVEQVRMGKYLEVQVDEPDQASAQARIDEMCRKLMANTVIEEYRFDLEEQ